MDDRPASDGEPRPTELGDQMMSAANYADLPLSPSYKLSAEQSAFFKAQTGIEDDEALKQHILDVQARTYKIFPYNCIRSFSFLQLAIETMAVYKDILKLGRERPNAVFLEAGTCFGVDGRKVVADGFPPENVVHFDLHREFLDLGHVLFKTTPALYPVNFVVGDVFDTSTLDIVPPCEQVLSTEVPDLSTLVSLNPLAGHCSVIHASRFFHLFSEERQHHLARALAGLLSPQSGSIICGQHAGEHEKGAVHKEIGGMALSAFCHSPQSWTDLWDGEVFPKGVVKVDTELVLVESDEGYEYWLMRWSVVRL